MQKSSSSRFCGFSRSAESPDTVAAVGHVALFPELRVMRFGPYCRPDADGRKFRAVN
jgi:hypothetical protein